MTCPRSRATVAAVDALSPNFDLVNPEHAAFATSRETSADLFAGRSVVKAAGDRYLFRSVREPDDWFAWRLKRAVYTNWLRAVIEARDALLWRKSPVREGLPPVLEARLLNVDRKRNSADAFFRDRCIRAEVDGVSFVLVNRPPAASAAVSRAEEQALDGTAYFEPVSAADMLDWSVGDDGALEWCVIKRDGYAPRQPGIKPKPIYRRLVWTRKEIAVFERLGKSGDFAQVGEAALNPIGAVPVVPFYGARVDSNVWGLGLPIGEDILNHCLDIYNSMSDAQAAMFLSCNPIFVTITPERHVPQEIDATHGKSLALVSTPGGGTVDAKWLEIGGAGIQVVLAHVGGTVRTIYEIALRQAKRDTAQVQAADSMREDQRVFRASLATVSKSREESEAECWRFAALWESVTEEQADRIAISYKKDFDDRMIEAQMLDAISRLAEGGIVSRRTIFEDVIKRGEIVSSDRSWEEEQEVIAREREDAAMPGFAAPSLGGGAPQGAPFAAEEAEEEEVEEAEE